MTTQINEFKQAGFKFKEKPEEIDIDPYSDLKDLNLKK